jgi:hypothetical protein
VPTNCTPEGNVLGHAWDQIPTPRDYKRNSGEEVITLRCTRCTSGRIDIVSSFAGVLISRYYQPGSAPAEKGLTMAERRMIMLAQARSQRRKNA